MHKKRKKNNAYGRNNCNWKHTDNVKNGSLIKRDKVQKQFITDKEQREKKNDKMK